MTVGSTLKTTTLTDMGIKPRKPRTKEQNPAYLSGHCPYDDGTLYKECGKPWAHLCGGDIHKCKKLKYKHLASLSEKEREKLQRRGY